MLQIFATAYNSKTLTVPLNWLQNVLVYSDGEQELFAKDLASCNLNPESNETKTEITVKFEKAKFDTGKMSVRLSSLTQ